MVLQFCNSSVVPRGNNFERVYIKMRWRTQRIDTVVDFAIDAKWKEIN